MAKLKNGWFKIQTATDLYYTNKSVTKKIYSTVGDGSRKPTPAEIKAAMESQSEAFFDSETDLMTEYDVTDTKKQPIDLPAGCYQHAQSSSLGDPPERLVPLTLRADSYIIMGSVYDPIVEDVRAFLKSEEIYRKIGTIYKRGLLLYGPPGEGKTSLIRCVAKNEFPEDAIVIFFESMPSNGMIESMKQTLGERFKVFIFEELANLLQGTRIERVLDFLDGEKSIDKTLMIATTNYPERLPGNIVERPSRFDKLIKMGHPKSSERKMLLNHYLTREATVEEVKITEGLSTAALKESCFLIHLKGVTLDDAVKQLKKHSELVKKDFAETRQMGLRSSSEDDFN